LLAAFEGRTVYGRQEPWEDSPAGWPQKWLVDGSNTRIDGRPIPQWSGLQAGRSDDLLSDPEATIGQLRLHDADDRLARRAVCGIERSRRLGKGEHGSDNGFQ
jgi:hypothetical protein